jgi:hypothetical protein
MALMTRVKRLERVRNGGGACTDCDGRGPIVISHWNEGDPEPVANGCPSCGEIFHIVVRHITMRPIAERHA